MREPVEASRRQVRDDSRDQSHADAVARILRSPLLGEGDRLHEVLIALERRGREEPGTPVPANHLAHELLGDSEDYAATNIRGRVFHLRRAMRAIQADLAPGSLRAVIRTKRPHGYWLDFEAVPAPGDAIVEDPASPVAPQPFPVRRRRTSLVALVATAILALAGMHQGVGRSSVGPVSVQWSGAVLRVVNAAGEVIAERTLAAEAVPPPPGREGNWQSLRDITGDGVDDVALLAVNESSTFGPRLLRLDGGSEDWMPDIDLTTQPGAVVRPWPTVFGIVFLRVIEDELGRADGFVVALGQRHGSLACIRRLTLDGESVGTYWLFGHPQPAITTLDLTGDARPELLVSARDDIAHRAMVLVFDSRRIDGAAPGYEDSSDLPRDVPGTHLVAIRLPHSWIGERGAAAGLKSYVTDISAAGEDELLLVLGETCPEVPASARLAFRFSRSLDLISVEPQDSFETATSTVLGVVPDDAMLDALGSRVEYHDATAWRAKPPRLAAPEAVRRR